MFGYDAEIRERLLGIIEKFREKGATSSDKALTSEALSLPPKFKELMKGHLGRLGVFVDVDGKYYLSEERLKDVKKRFVVERGFRREGHMQLDTVADDMMFKPPPPPPFWHWIRHTASVPKGFLRYYVLRLLKEKPMSGSEIMEKIERETDGRWKPSPGSVYPLLAWLQDNGYTKRLPKEEGGIKRYMLTEKGEKFFEEQAKFGERLRKKLQFLTPPFFNGFWFGAYPEKLREIREPVRRFTMALHNLRMVPRGNLTEQAIKEVRDILKEATEKIGKISGKTKRR